VAESRRRTRAAIFRTARIVIVAGLISLVLPLAIGTSGL
jgi:hypothetical protein